MKQKSRIHTIDFIRGIALINMIVYHICYDMAYIFEYSMPWYFTKGAWYWQQAIVIIFILISGMSFHFSHDPLRRSLTTLGGAFLLTLVTYVVTPDELILFGVLHFLGLAMLLTAILSPLLKKVTPLIGAIVFFLLFILTKQITNGVITFGAYIILRLPDALYQSSLGFIFGFPDSAFGSSDYVPLIPWIFLFFMGYYLNQLLFAKNNLPHWLTGIKVPVINQAGRHSFLIYLIHQPVIYAILMLLNH